MAGPERALVIHKSDEEELVLQAQGEVRMDYCHFQCGPLYQVSSMRNIRNARCPVMACQPCSCASVALDGMYKKSEGGKAKLTELKLRQSEYKAKVRAFRIDDGLGGGGLKDLACRKEKIADVTHAITGHSGCQAVAPVMFLTEAQYISYMKNIENMSDGQARIKWAEDLANPDVKKLGGKVKVEGIAQMQTIQGFNQSASVHSQDAIRDLPDLAGIMDHCLREQTIKNNATLAPLMGAGMVSSELVTLAGEDCILPWKQHDNKDIGDVLCIKDRIRDKEQMQEHDEKREKDQAQTLFIPQGHGGGGRGGGVGSVGRGGGRAGGAGGARGGGRGGGRGQKVVAEVQLQAKALKEKVLSDIKERSGRGSVLLLKKNCMASLRFMPQEIKDKPECRNFHSNMETINSIINGVKETCDPRSTRDCTLSDIEEKTKEVADEFVRLDKLIHDATENDVQRFIREHKNVKEAKDKESKQKMMNNYQPWVRNKVEKQVFMIFELQKIPVATQRIKDIEEKVFAQTDHENFPFTSFPSALDLTRVFLRITFGYIIPNPFVFSSTFISFYFICY